MIGESRGVSSINLFLLIAWALGMPVIGWFIALILAFTLPPEVIPEAK